MSFFEKIEKYRYGIMAVVITYVALFMYLQLATVQDTYEIAFWPSSYVEKPVEDEIELKPENIEVQRDPQTGKVINDVNNINDSRTRDVKDFSANKDSRTEEQKVKDFEQQAYSDAKAARESRDGKTERNKPQDPNLIKPKTNPSSNKPEGQNGSKNAGKGKFLVNYSLDERESVSLPAPAYKCGVGQSGVATIKIKVNKAGNVISAIFDASSSNGTTECIVQEALLYAKKSRFNYSGSASDAQSGYIQYEFISQ